MTLCFYCFRTVKDDDTVEIHVDGSVFHRACYDLQKRAALYSRSRLFPPRPKHPDIDTNTGTDSTKK